MKKIELVWNMVYYFIYKRYKGIFLLFSKKTYALNLSDVKSNRCMSLMFIFGSLISLSFFCILAGLYSKVFPNSLVIVIVAAIPSGVLNYFLLMYKDKCVSYFKEFETKPKQWKRKWSWFSFGTIVLIFVFLIYSFKFMDYSFHRRGVWHRLRPAVSRTI